MVEGHSKAICERSDNHLLQLPHWIIALVLFDDHRGRFLTQKGEEVECIATRAIAKALLELEAALCLGRRACARCRVPARGGPLLSGGDAGA